MPSSVGEGVHRLRIDVRNSEKELLSVNSTGWVYKICKCISNLQ